MPITMPAATSRQLDVPALEMLVGKNVEGLIRATPLLAHDDADRLVDNGAGVERGPQILDLACLLGPAGGRLERAPNTCPRDTAGPAEPDFPERAGARRVEVQRSDLPVPDPQGHRQRRPQPRRRRREPRTRPTDPAARCPRRWRPAQCELRSGTARPGAPPGSIPPGRPARHSRRSPEGSPPTSRTIPHDAPAPPCWPTAEHRQIRQQLVGAQGILSPSTLRSLPLRPSGGVGRMGRRLSQVSPRPRCSTPSRLSLVRAASARSSCHQEELVKVEMPSKAPASGLGHGSSPVASPGSEEP